MAKESQRVYARTEAGRRIEDAIRALDTISGDGLYATLPAKYATMIDTERRHLGTLKGRLRDWIITKRDKVRAEVKQAEERQREADTGEEV
jgi:hypothetical protein